MRLLSRGSRTSSFSEKITPLRLPVNCFQYYIQRTTTWSPHSFFLKLHEFGEILSVWGKRGPWGPTTVSATATGQPANIEPRSRNSQSRLFTGTLHARAPGAGRLRSISCHARSIPIGGPRVEAAGLHHLLTTCQAEFAGPIRVSYLRTLETRTGTQNLGLRCLDLKTH